MFVQPRVVYPWLCIGLALSLLVTGGGCDARQASAPKSSSPKPVNTAPLQVLVVDDAEFADNLQRLWNAQSETKVETKRVSSAELSADFGQVNDCDVVVYPSQLIGELASRKLLLKINPRLIEAKEFAAQDVMPLERDRLSRWGDDTLAVSMGHLPWVLMYREDLLTQAGLTPPQTWRDYEAACQQLKAPPADDDSIDAANWTATVEPTAPGWLGHLLLARVASYISHRGSYCGVVDLRSGEPLIATPAYARALDELVASQAAAKLPTGLSPDEGWRRLQAGQCAMAIGWPTTAASENATTLPLRIAPLPGSSEVYVASTAQWRDRTSDESPQVPYVGHPGRLVSIAEKSRRSGTAWGLVSWLSQKENQLQLSPASIQSFPTRYSLLAAADRWLATGNAPRATEDLGQVVRQYEQQFVVMSAPRFPTADMLLELLAQAAQEALAGEASQTALEKAGQAWQQELTERGAAQMTEEIELSLGL